MANSKFLFSVVFLLFFVSCSRKSSEPKDNVVTAFRKKPKPYTVMLIQLKEPALSETQNDAHALFKIEKEQEKAIQEIESLSSENRVLYRYQRVLNAIAVIVKTEELEKLNKLDVKSLNEAQTFNSPKLQAEKTVDVAEDRDLSLNNSMTHIGVDKIRKMKRFDPETNRLIPIKGKGVKIGIIDSGIDYTHKMFGGEGTEAVYNSIDPTQPTKHFPNKRVVGGYDFVGESYDSSSYLYKNRIPQPDSNPIDKRGHGTHVAGTAGGQGDGINTYDGAASEADLYALKVFGKGRASEEAVLAAFEFSLDPNKDFDFNDKLDVLNLSLGSDFGTEQSLYALAVKNLTAHDILIVASAGNSGDESSVVGSPSAENEAFSVANSIDASEQNITFPAVEIEFSFKGREEALVEKFPVYDFNPKENLDLTGELFYIGIGKSLTDRDKEGLKRKVALIDRGEITFVDKIKTALSGGAIGVVIVNNKEDLFGTGALEEDPQIPVVMIGQEVGEVAKKILRSSRAVAQVHFSSNLKAINKDQVDALYQSSSVGPRSFDGALKPEITAPGTQIISAKVGSGDKGVMLTGTSMAAPHISGVAALLLQRDKNLKPHEIKSRLMTTAKTLYDKDKKEYLVSAQGAGLVQAAKAIDATTSFFPAGISLGINFVLEKKYMFNTLKITNSSFSEKSYKLEAMSSDQIKIIDLPTQVTVPGQSSLDVKYTVLLSPNNYELYSEVNAFIKVIEGQKSYRIPALAIISLESQIFSELKYQNEEPVVEFTNRGPNPGLADLFYLLGQDERKPLYDNKIFQQNRECDLQSVGYRVVEKKGKKFVQIAVKTYDVVTNWASCYTTVEVDYDSDKKPEQDMAYIDSKYIYGFDEDPSLRWLDRQNFIFDSELKNKLEREYSDEVALQNPNKEPKLSLVPALLEYTEGIVNNYSTYMVLEFPIKDATKKMGLRVSLNYLRHSANTEPEDFLGESESWKTVFVDNQNLPEKFWLRPNEKEFVKINNKSDLKLVSYFPRNSLNKFKRGKDEQEQILDVSTLTE